MKLSSFLESCPLLRLSDNSPSSDADDGESSIVKMFECWRTNINLRCLHIVVEDYVKLKSMPGVIVNRSKLLANG